MYADNVNYSIARKEKGKEEDKEDGKEQCSTVHIKKNTTNAAS